MLAAVLRELPGTDVFISTAAVADYRPARAARAEDQEDQRDAGAVDGAHHRRARHRGGARRPAVRGRLRRRDRGGRAERARQADEEEPRHDRRQRGRPRQGLRLRGQPADRARPQRAATSWRAPASSPWRAAWSALIAARPRRAQRRRASAARRSLERPRAARRARSRCASSMRAWAASSRCRPTPPTGSAGLDLRACLDARPAARARASAELIPTGLAIHVEDPGLAARDPAALGARPQARHRARQPGRADRLGLPGPAHGVVLEPRREPFTVQPGERIAQLVVVPVVQVELEMVADFAASARGAGGFGHSGQALSARYCASGSCAARGSARCRRRTARAASFSSSLLAASARALLCASRSACAPGSPPGHRACAGRGAGAVGPEGQARACSAPRRERRLSTYCSAAARWPCSWSSRTSRSASMSLTEV